MASRGIPWQWRCRRSFPSSNAATIPLSPRSAAAGSCASDEMPRMYIFMRRLDGVYCRKRRLRQRGITRESRNGAARTRLGADVLPRRSTAGEQSTEAHQQQTRLALANVPQNAHGVVARILSQGTPGRIIQQVDQAAIVRLLKMVQRFAQQQMGIQLT